MANSELMRAVEISDYSTVYKLLNADGNPNLVFPNEKTLLHQAFDNGHLSIVKLLLNKGADITIPNPQGNLPIQRVFWFMQYSGSHDYIQSLLILHILLEKGANPNVLFNGHSLLVNAIYRNRAYPVQMLLNAGADVNFDNPLEKILIEMHNNTLYDKSILDMLLAQNPNLSVVDADGNGYGHGCVILDLPHVLKKLIKKGLNLNIKNKDGKTAFNLAQEKGDRELMTLIGNYMTKKNIKARTARRAISGLPSLPNNVAHHIANFAVGELTPNEPRWRTGALVPGLTRQRLYTPAYQREQEANNARRRNTAVRKIQTAWKGKKTRRSKRV